MHLSTEVYTDILDSLNVEYLLFSRYTSTLFYDIADKYLLKKACTRQLKSMKEFYESSKWVPKEFGIHLNLYKNKNIHDISFLEGVNIKILTISHTQVSNLSPLRNSPIKELRVYKTPITDLSPLQRTNIEFLNIGGTSISDLSPLKNSRIKDLWTYRTSIKDLSSLKSTPIEVLSISETNIVDLSPLFNVSSLKILHCYGTNPNFSHLEFLKEKGVKIYS